MKHRFLRLCAVMVASVALTPAVTAVAVADPGPDLSVGPPGREWRTEGGRRTDCDVRDHSDQPWASHGNGAVLTASTPDQFNFVFADLQPASFCGSGGELAPGRQRRRPLLMSSAAFPKASRTTSAGAGVTSADDPRISNDTASVVTGFLARNGFSFPRLTVRRSR
jgi:hypothetical protein